jgi:uncharacterized protein
MTTHTTDWTLTNDLGRRIIGNTDHPTLTPHSCLLLLHGFKGYKDYGFIPLLAKALAQAGTIVHRFNFSCSGMTNTIETFERPDLFAFDTWNRQVEDVHCVIDAIHTGAIDGAGLPLFIAGHSRGGATTLLTSGRDSSLQLAGVITINAVDRCDGISDEQRQELLESGSITTLSARTGQALPINASWLQEQLDDPDAHNVLNLCTKIKTSSLVLHGTDDPGVPFEVGERIASALNTCVRPIQSADHVLNTANPAPKDTPIAPQLREVIELISKFVNTNH